MSRTISQPGQYRAFLCDLVAVRDGGRITLSSEIRARAGWPSNGKLEIIIQLIAPECVELHIQAKVVEELARVRALPDRHEGSEREKTRLRQAVDDTRQAVNYNPEHSRIDLPLAVLAYLGVLPLTSAERSAATGKKAESSRYGNQFVYVQAGEGFITIMSLDRRDQRAKETIELIEKAVED